MMDTRDRYFFNTNAISPHEIFHRFCRFRKPLIVFFCDIANGLACNDHTSFRMYLFGIILANNHFFYSKKLVFVYLDNFLKFNRILKKLFSAFLEKLKRIASFKKSVFNFFN